MKQCAFCEAEVEEGQIICPHCGHSQFRPARRAGASRPGRWVSLGFSWRRAHWVVQRGRVKKGSLVLGLALVVWSGFVLWLFGRSTTLTCRRVEPTLIDCDVQNSLFGLLPLGDEQSISGLQGAWADPSCGARGCVYYVKLKTREGDVSLSPDLPYRDAHEITKRITRFVEDRQANSLAVKNMSKTLALLGIPCVFAPSFILGGLLWAVGLGIEFHRSVGGQK